MALRGFGRLRVKTRLGPELAPALEAANWTVTGEDGTHIVTFSNGTMRYQSDTTTPVLSVAKSAFLTIGRTYQVTVTTSAYASGSLRTDSLTITNVISSAVGTVTIRGIASSAVFSMSRATTNVDLTLSSVSVKEVM